MAQCGMGRGLQGFLELAGIQGKNSSVFNVLRINPFPAGKMGIKPGIKKAGKVKILGEKKNTDSQKLGIAKLPADLFRKSQIHGNSWEFSLWIRGLFMEFPSGMNPWACPGLGSADSRDSLVGLGIPRSHFREFSPGKFSLPGCFP